jgi:predicted protein tyrosine phosphatase
MKIMNAYKPGSRTIKAMKSLVEKLDLSMDRSLHEWSIELAERNQLREVIFFYDSLTIADEKFVLMEILVQAANDQYESKGQCNAWEMIEQRLVWDFNIHKQTVHRWACPGIGDLDSCEPITHYMRELWDMSKIPKTRILFICTINLMRSATAHKIYTHDLRFEVKSAGTHRSAETVLSKELLDWAEMVVVMEERHFNFIRITYPAIFKGKNIVCLDVPDNYDYMQAELMVLLRDRFEELI